MLKQDRADKKRYPAVNPIDSYSKYIEYPEFEEYIKSHINGEWIGKVNELKTRLQRGKEIAEQINILGDDGVPVEYHVTFWKSELIDFVILQQDAFDEIDAVTPMERQEDILNMIIDICHTEFEFDNFNDVMDYFKKMINVCKQMNYSKFKSEEYEGFKQQLKELIAEHRSGVFDTWLEQDKISCLPNYALPAVISPTAFTSMVPKSLYTAEEDMNEYEFKVVWALSALGNVKWWHRNISRLGFQINGPVHAYPDIIVLLNSGKVLMVETKGDHLDNDESKEKAKIGDQWAKLAGKQYKYYMVFETKQPDYPGAYSLERFMEIVK